MDAVAGAAGIAVRVRRHSGLPKTGRGGHHLDPGRQPAVHGAAGGRLPRRPGGAARESAGAVRRSAAGGGRLSGGETQLLTAAESKKPARVSLSGLL